MSRLIPWLAVVAVALLPAVGRAADLRPKQTLSGHAGFVEAVAFSPDSKLIASAGKDGVVVVWDVATGKEKFRLEGHTDRVAALAFSPDGQHLASASFDTTVWVWDVTTGKKAAVLRDHSGMVNAVTFSPDGKRLATGSSDKSTILWDAETFKKLATLDGGFFAVSAVSFSGDGKVLATGSHVGAVTLWDLETKKAKLTIETKQSVIAAAISPDGKTLATSTGSLLSLDTPGNITLWDVETKKQRAELAGHTGRCWRLGFSKDGKQLITANFDKTAKVWDVATGKELHTLGGHTEPVMAAALSPDGKLAATGGYDKTVRVWDLGAAGGPQLIRHNLRKHTSEVGTLAVSPDGKWVVTGGLDKTARIWEVATGKELVVLTGHTGGVLGVAVSPDGKTVATASGDKTVILWEAATGKKLVTLPAQKHEVTATAFSPDGKSLATATGFIRGEPGELVLWEVESGRRLHALAGNRRSIFALLWRADGMFSGGGEPGQSPELIEWDLAEKKPKTTFDGLKGGFVTSIAADPTGKLLVVANFDRAFVVIDRKTGKVVSTIKGHATEVQGVAVSPDGKWLASASDDRSVRVWDAATGTERAVLNGHLKSATAVAFIPNMQLLVSSDAGGLVIVWDLGVALGGGAALPGEGLSFARFESKAGGFRVLMPGQPEEKTKKIPTPAGEVTSTFYVVREKRATYGVSHSKMPALVLNVRTPAQLLDDTVGGVVSAAGKKLKDTPVTLGEHPGREVLAADADGVIYTRARLYVVRGVVYQVTVSGPGREFVTNDDATRFLDSFRDLPPELTKAERDTKEKELEKILMAGEAAREKKDYATAAREFEKARPITRALGKDYETLLGATTGMLAELYTLHLGRPDLAEPLYREALADMEGDTDPETVAGTAALMVRLGQLYQQQKQYAKAEAVFRRAIVKAAGDPFVTATAKIGLAQIYYSQDLYAKAEPLFREGIAAGKGVDDPAGMIEVARCQLAGIHRKAGRNAEAEKQLREIIRSTEADPKKEPSAAYLAVGELLHLYKETGRTDAAAELVGRVPRLAVRATPMSSKSMSVMYLGVYHHYLDRGEMLRAEAAAADCAQLLEANFGPKHPLLASLAYQVGVMKLMRGDLVGAETALQRCMAILDDPAKPNRIEKVRVLEAMAGVHLLRAEYAKAEQTCQTALAVLDAMKSPPHDVHRARVRATLAVILSSAGRRGESLELLEDIVKNISTDPEDENLDLAGVLSLVTELYWNADEWPKAEALLKRITGILERIMGKDHPFIALQYVRLAQFNLHMNRIDEGIRLARLADTMLETTQGKDSLMVGHNRMTLAMLHLARGERKEALRHLERVQGIYTTHMGRDNPMLSGVLVELAALHAGDKNPDRAAELFDEARRINFRHAHHLLPALGESEQVVFLSDQDTPNLFAALSLAVARPRDEQLAARSAAWVLNGKGTALRVLAERQILARQSNDPTVGNLVRDWVQVRQELAGATLSQPEPGKEAERNRRIGELRRIEADLSRRIGKVVGRAEQPWVELDEVRKVLPADGVLIEIVRMDVATFGAPAAAQADPHYVAWIIRPGEKERVEVIDLGPAKAIDRAVRAFRERMGKSKDVLSLEGELAARKDIQGPLDDLRRLILQPLLPHIKDKERWLISPDGETWHVPFAALPLDETTFAVEKHRIRYLVSGRDLLWTAPDVRTNPPLVMADPDYYLDLEKARAETRRMLGQPPPPPAPRRSAVRRFDGIDRRMPRLEYTAKEAEKIAPHLEKYAGAKPVVYTRGQALEGVARAAERPSVLVLATHGFIVEPEAFAGRLVDEDPYPLMQPLAAVTGFATHGHHLKHSYYSKDLLDRRIVIMPDQPGTFSIRDIMQLHEHPALLCGLVLAGANKRGQGDALGEDGILTAWEVLGVDLRGTRLVVLSACETALGRVQDARLSGACVAGLRQAFLVAGSQKVVASLWKVGDEETALLMEEFFTRLAAGESEEDALRAAQLSRLAAHRAKNKVLHPENPPAHPFYWAAFTITGQGR